MSAMLHRNFVYFFLFSLTLPSPVFGQQPAVEAVQAQDTQGVMVWKIRPKMGVVEQTIDSLSGLLTAEVAKYTTGAVISEEDMKTILRTTEQRLRCDPNSATCLAEMGQALGVPEVVAGDLGLVGNYWVLNLRRIDVQKVRVVKRVSVRVRADLDEIIEILPNLVAQLFGRPPTEVQVAHGEVPLREQEPVFGGEVVSLGAEHQRGMSAYKISGWTTAGMGIGMLVLGALGTGMAYDASQGGSRSARDDAKTWNDLAIAGYTVGAALVVTGTILLIMDPGSEKPEARTVRFGVAPVKSGFSVMLGGKW
jgi:hypothetical protein